jgi:hypothetical protein
LSWRTGWTRIKDKDLIGVHPCESVAEPSFQPRLDLEYLREWSRELRVEDLLTGLLNEGIA